MNPTLSEIANQVLESCESTNDLAKSLGEAGYPHGTWVSAREQTRGRGRLGRAWSSQQGNLFLSILARFEPRELWSWVPLATAIGVAECLIDRYPELPARIKWPNDLWVGGGCQGVKLGGILCEAVGNRAGAYIVIGLGLNCASSPLGLDQRTTSLTEELPGRGLITANALRLEIVASILQTLQRLEREGSAPFVSAYERLAAFPPGMEITWSEGVHGKVLKLGPSGELCVVMSDGEIRSLYAEDVKVRALFPDS